MSTSITITGISGPCLGQKFVFEAPKRCMIGRSENCQLRISGNCVSMTVSRRHCMIEIDSLTVRIRDLGSLNGTFVNGVRIGKRNRGAPPPEAGPAENKGIELHDGDRVLVGPCEFQVEIRMPIAESAPETPGIFSEEESVFRNGLSLKFPVLV